MQASSPSVEFALLWLACVPPRREEEDRGVEPLLLCAPFEPPEDLRLDEEDRGVEPLLLLIPCEAPEDLRLDDEERGVEPLLLLVPWDEPDDSDDLRGSIANMGMS